MTPEAAEGCTSVVPTSPLRDDRFKANLAAAYLEQIRETGPRGVYDVIAGSAGRIGAVMGGKRAVATSQCRLVW